MQDRTRLKHKMKLGIEVKSEVKAKCREPGMKPKPGT